MHMRYPIRLSRLAATLVSATLFLAGARGQSANDPGSVPEPALAPPMHQPIALAPDQPPLMQREGPAATAAAPPSGEVNSNQQSTESLAGRRRAFVAQIYADLLTRFDTTHQGFLSPGEQGEALAALAQEHPRIYRSLLRRFGADAQGALDPAQMAALFHSLVALAAGPQGRVAPAIAPAGGGARRFAARLYQRLLAAFDQGHQGVLNPAEQAQALAYLSTHAPRVYGRLVQRFDRNGDGVLDAAETATLFATLAQLAATPPPA